MRTCLVWIWYAIACRCTLCCAALGHYGHIPHETAWLCLEWLHKSCNNLIFLTWKSRSFCILFCISGHHHHEPHPPSPVTSYCAPGQTRDTGTVVTSVGDIDYQMYHVLQSIPLAIQEARWDVMSRNSTEGVNDLRDHISKLNVEKPNSNLSPQS